MRSVFKYLLMLGVCLCWTPATAEDPAVKKDKVARINLAIQQGTLIQSMTQAACFAMADVDAKRSGNKALEDIDTYETVLEALRDGHEWLGLLPEARPEMLTDIATTEEAWQRYRPNVQQIVARDYHTVIINLIYQLNAPATDSSTWLAQQFIDAFGSDVFDPSFNAALLLAGHHRMLSQRALLELCFVMAGVGGDGMRARLDLTLKEFEAAFETLAEGNSDIAPPPNARISRNYRTAKLFWKKMRPVLEKAINGDQIAEADVTKVLKFNKSVLKQLNQAVEGYLVGS